MLGSCSSFLSSWLRLPSSEPNLRGGIFIFFLLGLALFVGFKVFFVASFCLRLWSTAIILFIIGGLKPYSHCSRPIIRGERTSCEPWESRSCLKAAYCGVIGISLGFLLGSKVLKALGAVPWVLNWLNSTRGPLLPDAVCLITDTCTGPPGFPIPSSSSCLAAVASVFIYSVYCAPCIFLDLFCIFRATARSGTNSSSPALGDFFTI